MKCFVVCFLLLGSFVVGLFNGMIDKGGNWVGEGCIVIVWHTGGFMLLLLRTIVWWHCARQKTVVYATNIMKCFYHTSIRVDAMYFFFYFYLIVLLFLFSVMFFFFLQCVLFVDKYNGKAHTVAYNFNTHFCRELV